VLCLVLHLVLVKSFFPHEFIYTKEFAEKDLLYKWVYSIFTMVATRFGYFFTFCLAEGANILNGFGFNGKNEKGEVAWNRLASVTILKVEFAQSPRDISTYWNMTVGHWLKHYVYLRGSNVTKPPPNWRIYFTNLLSGLWHGFYPGYFIHFFTAAVLVELARRTRNKIRPLVLPEDSTAKKAYDLIGIVFIKAMMGYSMSCFVGLSWENNLAYLTAMGFSGHIFLAVAMVFLIVVPIRRPGSGKPVHDERPQPPTVDSKKEE